MKRKSFSIPYVTDWAPFTPTGSFVANSTYVGRWRKVGDMLECMVKITFSGAPTSTQCTINLPFGTVDTAKMNSSTAVRDFFGFGVFHDATGSGYQLGVHYNSTTSVYVGTFAVGGTYSTIGTLTELVPVTVASGDWVEVTFSVPISGWKASRRIN